MLVATSMHPVAEVTIVEPRVAFSTCLTMMGSSQPAQSL